MIVQSACQSASTRVLATEDLRRPKCPDCGSVLLIAEESRFNLRGRIDHAWSCDALRYCVCHLDQAAAARPAKYCLPV